MEGHLHRYSPASHQDTVLDMGQPVGAAAVRRDGGLVLALRDGFAVVDSGSTVVRIVTDTEQGVSRNRMNDGKCDAMGRFWAGTMPLDEASPTGALYRLDPDFSAHAMVLDVTISNGLDWSPDQRHMYYIDTATMGVDVFDFDLESGSIANRRRLITLHSGEGSPDGMTVDAEGCLWIALWGGRAVRRYLPDGTLDQSVTLPVSKVTSCAFGGPELEDLYITTAAIGLTEAELTEQPYAGGIFRARVGVKGRPANTFAR
jgi:sugar lactone lactonase YvrE